VHVLLHWDGQSWQSSDLPDLHLPAGEFGVPSGIAAVSPRDVWVAGYVSTATAAQGAFLLHWDGTAWHQVRVPDPGLGLDAVAQDGQGGVWLCGTAADDITGLPEYLYHYRNGRWTSQHTPERNSHPTLLSGLSWIPGTKSAWAQGLLDGTSPDAGYQAAILRYGQ